MIVTRVGFGEDSHAFVRDLVSLQAEHNVSVLSADYITLAGAKINTPLKLQANSDGDVVLSFWLYRIYMPKIQQFIVASIICISVKLLCKLKRLHRSFRRIMQK